MRARPRRVEGAAVTDRLSIAVRCSPFDQAASIPPSYGMRYFEDFTLGASTSPQATYLVEEEEIIEVGTRWDPNYFHTDPVAARDSIFGGLVAASAHVFAIFCWLGHQMGEEVAVVSSLGFDQLRMLAPVRPGDRISYKTTTVTLRPSASRPGTGIVDTLNELFNQSGEKVFSVRCAMLVRSRNPRA